MPKIFMSDVNFCFKSETYLGSVFVNFTPQAYSGYSVEVYAAASDDADDWEFKWVNGSLTPCDIAEKFALEFLERVRSRNR